MYHLDVGRVRRGNRGRLGKVKIQPVAGSDGEPSPRSLSGGKSIKRADTGNGVDAEGLEVVVGEQKEKKNVTGRRGGHRDSSESNESSIYAENRPRA